MSKYWTITIRRKGKKQKKKKLRIPREARPFISEHISRHIREYGMPREQAIALALEEARRKGYDIPYP